MESVRLVEFFMNYIVKSDPLEREIKSSHEVYLFQIIGNLLTAWPFFYGPVELHLFIKNPIFTKRALLYIQAENCPLDLKYQAAMYFGQMVELCPNELRIEFERDFSIIGLIVKNLT